MAWKLTYKPGGKYSTALCYTKYKVIGTTITEHICQNCGFNGHFAVRQCTDCLALLFIPMPPATDYFSGVCPKCKTEIPINIEHDFNPDPVK